MKKTLLIALIGLSLTSCKEDDNISVPTFEVTTDKQTYSLGDTVRFKFSGDADYLTMYTGEAGSKYENKDRLRAEGTITCEITARPNANKGMGSLSFFVSTNLNPLRDSADIVDIDKNWKNITHLYTIPTTAPASQQALGIADITSFTEPNKPLYIAVRVKNDSATVFKPGNTDHLHDKWTIGKILLKNTFSDGSGESTVGTIPTMGWKALTVASLPKYGFTVPTGTTTTIPMGESLRANTLSEHWIVSSAIYPDKALRDYPTTIKNQIELLPEEYQYIYKAKGTYKVVFIALNSRNGKTTTTTKEVEITIE